MLRQRQILGTHLPEDASVVQLLRDIKAIFESAKKRCVNEHNFEEQFEYLDLFLENEQERSFLMDRISDLVIDCGEAWFDENRE